MVYFNIIFCLNLCHPMDCSPPGSSIYGLLQARILEWGAIPFSRGSSRPRDQTQVSCIAVRFFTTEPPGKPQINKSSHKQSHFWNLEKMKQVSFKCSETMNTVFIHRTNNKNISIQFYSVRRRKQRTRENWISSYLAWMQMPGSRNGREASWGWGHRNKSLGDTPA